MKLHILVRLAKTSWETSFEIFFLSFGEMVVNHLANRTFPWRLIKRTKLIWGEK
jgi:hypothetical protein